MQKSAGTLKLFGLAVVAAVGVGSVILYTVKHDPNPTQSASAASLRPTTKPISNLETNEDKKTFSLQGQDGKTALELLRTQADVKTERSSFGEFVTNINGVEANGIGQLWAFYVDGELAKEDAQTYQTANGEHIGWRVEDMR